MAVNELLLQSFEGFLRLFPGWPIGEPASFQTLRAVGAFLVTADVDAAGLVAPVVVKSEAGVLCVVMSPWPGRLPTCCAKVSVTKTGGDMVKISTGSYSPNIHTEFPELCQLLCI